MQSAVPGPAPPTKLVTSFPSLLHPLYLAPDPEALKRTRQWIETHRRCAVQVEVRNGKIVAWDPFCNLDYRTNNRFVLASGRSWQDHYGPDQSRVLPDQSRWWFNGKTLCNIPSNPAGWGHAQLPELRGEIERALALPGSASISCCFFVNKRDSPYLAKAPGPLNPSLPAREAILPVLSQYGGDKYWDLMMPCSAVDELRRKPPVPPADWSARDWAAVFRGSATGAGCDPASNQRIALAKRRSGILDVGLVSYNQRDRIVGQDPTGALVVDCPDPSKLPKLVPRMSMDVQAKTYAYAVYVQGHSAALRYLELMLRGFVIFKVDSDCDAPKLWFFDELVADLDHVPVKADLSDLEDQIMAVRVSPDHGKAIADRALELGRKILTSASSYLQGLLRAISLEQSLINARERVALDPYWP